MVIELYIHGEEEETIQDFFLLEAEKQGCDYYEVHRADIVRDILLEHARAVLEEQEQANQEEKRGRGRPRKAPA